MGCGGRGEGGYEHFMIKEIHEQPKAVQDTLNSVIHDGRIDLEEIGLSDEDIRNISQIYMVACGSAYHVAVSAQYVFEDIWLGFRCGWTWLPSSGTGISRWIKKGL